MQHSNQMRSSSKTGIFTISLDYELHWGVMPRLSVEDYRENLEGTNQGIYSTLDLFKEFDIHATWATVGFLFFNNKEDLLKVVPAEKPSYKNSNYNSYKLFNTIGSIEKEAPFHYASSVIKEIAKVLHQEIATHTFSHYFCLEDGQSAEQFEADIKAAIITGKKLGFKIESIVFPRNQFNQVYIDICKKLGVMNIRGNQTSRIYLARKREEENSMIRILRLLDTYINITGYNVAATSLVKGVANIPASRFFRPFNSKLSGFERLKLRRIKNEMTYAARTRGVYHIWWHPHNFGTYTQQNINMLREILEHFYVLRKKYGFRSLNMKEIGQLVRHEK